MSQFEDRIKEHPIHETFAALSTLLDTMDGADEQQTQALNHARRVVDFGHDRLSNADAELVSVTSLNQAKKQADITLAVLDKWLNDKAIPNQVITATDALLDSMRWFPQLDPLSEAKHYSKALEDFRVSTEEGSEQFSKRISEAIQQINEGQKTQSNQVAQLNKQMTQLEQTINEQKSRLDVAISEYQTQFSTAEDTRRSEVNEAQQQRHTQFAEATAKRQEEFGKLASEAKTEVTKLLEQSKQSMETLLSETKQRVGDHITELEQKRDEAAELVQIIGNIGVTGKYHNIAEEEKKTAGQFRIAAIVFMVLMVGGVAWIVSDVVALGWDVAVFRIVTALILGVPAWYCAGESSKHRIVEQRNRRLELELASLMPFLATLDEEARKKVIETLSAKYFGQEHGDITPDQLTIPGSELFKALIDIAKARK